VASDVYPSAFYQVALGGINGGSMPDYSAYIPTSTGYFVWYLPCAGYYDPNVDPGPELNPYQIWYMDVAVTYTEFPVGIEEEKATITAQAQPNPAYTFTNIMFEIPSAGEVNLTLNDISGKQV